MTCGGVGFTVIAQLGSPGKGKSQWKSREALQLTACFRVSSWTNGWRQIRWSHGTVSGPPERGHATKRDDDGKNKAMDPCHAENMGRLLCFSPALLIFKPSPRPPTPNQEALARYWCQRCQRQVVVPPLPPPQRPEGETWTGLDHQQVGGGTSRRSGRAPPPCRNSSCPSEARVSPVPGFHDFFLACMCDGAWSRTPAWRRDLDLGQVLMDKG